MEILFRKYFWAVNLLFAATVAFLVARMVNLFVAAAIAPTSGPAVVQRAPSRMQPAEQVATLDLERLAKLLGLPIPQPEPEVTEPAPVDMNAEPVATSLRVKLLGTLPASAPEWSIASIQNLGDQKTRSYMVGDLVENAEILEIERTRVIVLNNGRKEFIDGSTGGAGGAAPPPPVASGPKPASTVPNSNLLGDVRALSENEYEVKKSEVEKTLANLNEVAMQARIVPSFKNGVTQGYKLFSIRPNSIYTKLGIQNGDVVKRINGYDFTSLEKVMEVFPKLRESSRIDIELERNGAAMRKTYNVR